MAYAFGPTEYDCLQRCARADISKRVMSAAPTEKQFFEYVIPSMLTMLLTGLYAIVDGFFIGHSVGDIGLAAINIAWPAAALILAAGTGTGTGGSVLLSTYFGEKDYVKSDKALGNTILLLIVLSAGFTLAFLFFYKPLLQFLGARGELQSAAEEYMRTISLGCSCQILGTGLAPLLRNKGKPIEAMAAMITGLISNILLDALFIMVFNLGMFGAALATVTAQAIVAALCFILLFRKKENRISLRAAYPQKKIILKSAKIGLSPFGISFAPSLIIIFTNWQCLAYGNTSVVAAYSVLSYFISVIQFLLQGVGDGIQPLISYFNGAHQKKSIQRTLNRAVIMILVLSAVSAVAGIFARSSIPKIFGASQETSAYVEQAIFISAFSYPFTGIARLAASFFYAIQKIKQANVLIFSDPLILTPIFVTLLPLLFGVTGIWLVLPATQAILFILAVALYSRYRRASFIKPNYSPT